MTANTYDLHFGIKSANALHRSLLPCFSVLAVDNLSHRCG